MFRKPKNRKVVIISGFFNPLHGGHLDMIEAAAAMGEKLVVIVNNDEQQIIKKGKVILDQENRARLMRALRVVDDVFIAVDQDPPVIRSLRAVAKKYPDDKLLFANGGDRHSAAVVPESDVCRELGIEMIYGVGGTSKADSSPRINVAMGHQAK